MLVCHALEQEREKKKTRRKKLEIIFFVAHFKFFLQVLELQMRKFLGEYCLQELRVLVILG